MIRGWAIRTLIMKELLEVVRDRRTLFLMVVLPLLVYPLLFLATSQVAIHQMEKIEAEVARVGVSPALMASLAPRVEKKDNIELVPVATEHARQLLAEGQLAGLVYVPDDFEAQLARDGTITVEVLFDATSETSRRVENQLGEILSRWSKELVAGRLARLSLPETFAKPLKLEAINVAPPQKVGGHVLGQIVPLLIVMMVVLGAFYPAIEVTAGEKERGTLQTLLTAPVTPLEIIFGKYVSVCVVAAIAGAANIASIGLLLVMIKLMPGAENLPLDVGLTPVGLLLVGFVALLVGLMFSAVMMTVAVLAKTFKEAQAYTTPVYLLSVAPVMFAQLPGMKLEGLLTVIPGLNQALLMREILEGVIDVQHFFVVVFSSAVYTVGTLIVAARIFERESILLGDAGVAELFKSGHSGPRLLPRTSEALGLLAVTFILFFYAGGTLQAWNVIWGLLLSHWGLLVGAVIVFVWLKKVSPVETLGLRVPGAKPMLAAALLGSSLWYALGLVMQRVVTVDPNDPQVRLLEAVLGDTPVWLLIFTIAITPIFSEELLFRGVLLRAMEPRFRTRTVVLTTALLFGAYHMSAGRMIPLTGLGVLMAFLALRSGSIVPAMLFHLLHNGISVLSAKLAWHIPGVTTFDGPDPVHVALCVAAIAAGIWLLVLSRPPDSATVVENTTP